MLIILILIAVYLAWLGFSLYRIKPGYSLLAWISSGLLGFLAIGGFFGFL